MTLYLIVKYLHVVGAAVLFGTGTGIAFFMLMAHLRAAPEVIADIARIVVIADFLFTATAVIAQPITGALLVRELGYHLTDRWLLWSIVLYIITGAFWLPVVWMQMRMRNLALEARRNAALLPIAYHRLFRVWFAFGFPALGAVLSIMWLMIARPS